MNIKEKIRNNVLNINLYIFNFNVFIYGCTGTRMIMDHDSLHFLKTEINLKKESSQRQLKGKALKLSTFQKDDFKLKQFKSVSKKREHNYRL